MFLRTLETWTEKQFLFHRKNYLEFRQKYFWAAFLPITLIASAQCILPELEKYRWTGRHVWFSILAIFFSVLISLISGVAGFWKWDLKSRDHLESAHRWLDLQTEVKLVLHDVKPGGTKSELQTVMKRLAEVQRAEPPPVSSIWQWLSSLCGGADEIDHSHPFSGMTISDLGVTTDIEAGQTACASGEIQEAEGKAEASQSKSPEEGLELLIQMPVAECPDNSHEENRENSPEENRENAQSSQNDSPKAKRKAGASQDISFTEADEASKSKSLEEGLEPQMQNSMPILE